MTSRATFLLLFTLAACGKNGATPTATGGSGAMTDGTSGATAGNGGSKASGGAGSAGSNAGGSNAGTSGNTGGSGGTSPGFKTDNLLVNGDAEASLDHWEPVGTNGFQPAAYGVDGYPAAADPGPKQRGLHFFNGGQAPNADSHQLVDLSAFSERIAVGARFTLSGYLGGFEAQEDRASIVLTFLADDGTSLDTITIGGPFAAERIGKTGLFASSMDGKVPPAAHTADVHVVMTRAVGMSDDGYADNLSLVLHD